MRKIISEKKNVWWGRPLLPEILGQLTQLERNRRFARSASAVTPSEKVQLTLIGSPLRAFQ